MAVKLLEQWLPPDGAGAPLACLATTFTFDGDFFATDCLARFLGLTGLRGEGDQHADVAALIEEEERLAEARVVVVADRSCRPESRNLRWDLLTASVPGGLLHAKVAVLIWERAMRVLIGSANLTKAGYRAQLELAAAFDIGPDNDLPHQFVADLLVELRSIVREHTPGRADRAGPRQRALAILDLAQSRARESLSDSPRSKVRVALAPGGPGRRPLEVRTRVWRGAAPRSVTALSPFWDDENSSLPGAAAVLAELSSRTLDGVAPSATFVTAVDLTPTGHKVRAPRGLADLKAGRTSLDVREVSQGDEPRLLHAKAVLYEGEGCVALMVGSSNITQKGLGLAATSHREINVWFAADRGTREAQALAKVIPVGSPVEPEADWEPPPDDEEEAVEPLPDIFVDALVESDAGHPVLMLTFAPADHPEKWEIGAPGVGSILTSGQWREEGKPTIVTKKLSTTEFPSALDVSWSTADGTASCSWPVNVGDLSALPPTAELKDLPVSVLLAVLASTRPLRVAIEEELKRHARAEARDFDVELDPLRRFDASGQLLYRVRHHSAALWGLQTRLSRPIPTVDALEWRLNGSIGPRAIADGLAAGVEHGSLRAAEARFLLGELALTLARVNWLPGAGIRRRDIDQRLAEVIRHIASCAGSMTEQSALGDAVHRYLDKAFATAAGNRER